ncbi:hypothetical protein BJ912DRAFT_125465 [Pholiota molesta]|nr:hypothetical protein BJ912DRAFT_125465 [Pholiota molesta]
MLSLNTLFNSLEKIALQSCSFYDVDLFLRLCVYFKQEIKLHTPLDSNQPPYKLPAYLEAFLTSVLSLESALTQSLWRSLKDIIWTCNQTNLTEQEMQQVDRMGTKAVQRNEHLASAMFYPPVDRCRECDGDLKSLSRIPIRYYTATGSGLNAREGYSSSFKCQDCKIRYYHNYYSQNGIRHFYDSYLPRAIQIEDHAYIETELCELFTSLMLFGWVSSQNCANILNASIDRHDSTNSLSINSEQVYRAFVMNGLLRDCSETGNPLVLPDIGDNDTRLKCPMDLRNKKMILVGQQEKMHACEKCEKFIEGSGYKGLRSLRATVTDGLSIGRPCCKVHNCTKPLPTNRDHFCIDHQDLKAICVVTECTGKADVGFQTCAIPAHRAMEDRRKEHGKAFFQLRKRLNTQFSTTQLPDSISSSDNNIPEIEDGTNEDNTQDSATRKSDAGNKAPKARFARRRTHNEQLIVSCCGIILARGTMFGAEAISGVKDFLKSVYPCADDLPDVIFYDNNCHLQAHLHAQKDEYFKDVILPVDVFHFKSKHSVKDDFCQRHCNPAKWTELADKDGKWVFNSSAAEQVNAWLGGYLAIVRDMLPHRYDFFLDEMIKRRNEIVLRRLNRAGHPTYYVPLFCNTVADT